MSSTEVLRVVEEIRIHAAPERVFGALTDPAELTSWWSVPDEYVTREAEVDVRPGGRYVIRGTSVHLGTIEVTGEYRVVDPPRRLSYTWTPDWDGGARDSLVDIRLEPDGDGTRVVLTHTRFTTSLARDDHKRGWSAVFRAVKTHCEKPRATR